MPNYIVIHERHRECSDEPWLQESDFRYWNDRRSVLKKTGVIICESMFEGRFSRIRMEVWRSKDDYISFREDVCARVIDAVIRHEESANRGIIHETKEFEGR